MHTSRCLLHDRARTECHQGHHPEYTPGIQIFTGSHETIPCKKILPLFQAPSHPFQPNQSLNPNKVSCQRLFGLWTLRDHHRRSESSLPPCHCVCVTVAVRSCVTWTARSTWNRDGPGDRDGPGEASVGLPVMMGYRHLGRTATDLCDYPGVAPGAPYQ